MGSQTPQLHFVLFPLMAQGHMIPMVDMARMLAQRGVTITIFTTPFNAARFKSVLDRAIEMGLQIRVIELKFPCQEAGLPEGCENFDMLPSPDLAFNFYNATAMLQEQVERLFPELTPKPNCIIADLCLPYTNNIANMFDVPRISFHVHCCFSLLCMYNLGVHYKVLERVTSDSEYFIVPGNLPDRIEVTKAQIPGALLPNLKDFMVGMGAAERSSYGSIVTTYEELEGPYVHEYKNATKKNHLWSIGPTFLSNQDDLERGKKSAIDNNQCLKWLDSWEPNSVLYVCLGSLCNVMPLQLMELGLGLEESKKPFIWVLKDGRTSKELDELLLKDGFEERNKERGLLIRGWAPQVLILSHQSTGGFITHCGMSSYLEAVAAGVPMATWPLFGDQFFAEHLLVTVLKIAVRIGVPKPLNWGEEEKTGILVYKENVKVAIEILMDEGKTGQERRERVGELSILAKRAVQEGGSSYANITNLIQHFMQL
ncbi:UDP-glycosyltransferase 73C1-like [Argentina anserina]|uniref:UDP-glycosyltransferase 73C1-like n=1 Tax=Argentina anserina TaxID=57926 RepID=UPI0021768093|nr:UDP-glycosyltransferase 73C1-like [Potentilla anserina]